MTSLTSLQRQETEDQLKEIQRDVEMNGKESRQDTIEEEKERQKRRKHEVEKEIDIMGIPLEQSIWAPSRRSCNENQSLIANISAYNVSGKMKEERISFIKWSLKDSDHVKDVKEVFKRGNTWIEVNFDCEYGRDEAIRRISKKEGDWFKLIPEQTERHEDRWNKHARDHQAEKEISKKKEEKWKIEDEEETRSQNFREDNYLTIWDLPVNIDLREVKHACRNIKGWENIRIKRSRFRAVAVLRLQEDMPDKKLPWVVPLESGKLARVSKGIEDPKARDKRHQNLAKIRGIPREAQEVLLLRCLKDKGAKAIYIPRRRGGSAKDYAVVTFESQQDLEDASSKPFRYNNWLLKWAKKSKDRTAEQKKEERQGK